MAVIAMVTCPQYLVNNQKLVEEPNKLTVLMDKSLNWQSLDVQLKLTVNVTTVEIAIIGHNFFYNKIINCKKFMVIMMISEVLTLGIG